jgi:hypothetical protein
MILLPGEYEVHRVAATDMRARGAEMPDQVGIVTAGIEQGVGEDPKASRCERTCRQEPIVIRSLRQVRNQAPLMQQERLQNHRAKRARTEDAAKEPALEILLR